MAKIYGKHIATYSWCKGDTSIVNRHLEVYLTTKYIKCVLWNSSVKGWRGGNHLPISTTNYPKDTNVSTIVNNYIEDGKHLHCEEPPFHNYGTIK